VRGLATAVALAALAAAGCGGAAHTAAPAPPKLPRALAHLWAQQADQIAAALAAGDGCTAETQAVALRTQVVLAVNERRVARRFRGPLVGTVNDLPDRIACNPAPAPAPAVTTRGHEHRHGHGHGYKHGGHGDGG
jgi:hypothetical protein